MKYFKLLSVAILFIALTSFKADYAIPTELKWETHFKAKPDLNSRYFALTAMTWKYSYTAKISKNNVKINLTNEFSQDPNRSWVKLDKITSESMSKSLLHHEQGHVNIQNILKIEANRVLKSQTYSLKNYKNEIAQLANEISSFYDTMQRNYDIETEHGSNHKMQARWDNIIEEKTLEVSNLQ